MKSIKFYLIINQINWLSFWKRNRLSMVYKASKYLCTTTMLIFYRKIGMTIKNVTMAIEYQKGWPLKKFVNEVTSKRIAATITGEVQKQNLFKLVINSSYGRTGAWPQIYNLELIYFISRFKYSQLYSNNLFERKIPIKENEVCFL